MTGCSIPSSRVRRVRTRGFSWPALWSATWNRSRPRTEGGSMLERWLQTAAEAAGVADADPTLVGPEAVTAILDLARDAAHGVARPAAPLAAFVAGLAVGR